jgi:solute carrier family 34 (sodium-dependent phosphate cotransporter)
MNEERFRLSFAGATVHDIFNLLTVLILLPLEVLTGFIERTSHLLVKSFKITNSNSTKNIAFLNALTHPLTKSIIQLDESVLEHLANNDTSTISNEATLIKHNCVKPSPVRVHFANGYSAIYMSDVEFPCKTIILI